MAAVGMPREASSLSKQKADGCGGTQEKNRGKEHSKEHCWNEAGMLDDFHWDRPRARVQLSRASPGQT
jgi:hypothetical protein